MTNMPSSFIGGGLMGHGMAKNIVDMTLPLVTVAEPAVVPHMKHHMKREAGREWSCSNGSRGGAARLCALGADL